jgi:hypothetical protein
MLATASGTCSPRSRKWPMLGFEFYKRPIATVSGINVDNDQTI